MESYNSDDSDIEITGGEMDDSEVQTGGARSDRNVRSAFQGNMNKSKSIVKPTDYRLPFVEHEPPNKSQSLGEGWDLIYGTAIDTTGSALGVVRKIAGSFSADVRDALNTDIESIGSKVKVNPNHYSVSNSLTFPVKDHGITQYEAFRFTNSFFSEMRVSLDNMINYFQDAKIEIINYSNDSNINWDEIFKRYKNVTSIMSSKTDWGTKNLNRHKIEAVNKYRGSWISDMQGQLMGDGSKRWPNLYRKNTGNVSSSGKDSLGTVAIRYDTKFANKEYAILKANKRDNVIKEIDSDYDNATGDVDDNPFKEFKEKRIGIDRDKKIPTFRAMLTVIECDEIIEYLKNVRKMFIVMTDIDLCHKFQYSDDLGDFDANEDTVFGNGVMDDTAPIIKIKKFFNQRKEVASKYYDKQYNNGIKIDIGDKAKNEIFVGANPADVTGDKHKYHITKVPLGVVEPGKEHIFFPHMGKYNAAGNQWEKKISADYTADENNRNKLAKSGKQDDVAASLKTLSDFYNLAQDIDYNKKYTGITNKKDKDNFLERNLPDSALCIPLPPLCFVNSYIDVKSYTTSGSDPPTNENSYKKLV